MEIGWLRIIIDPECIPSSPLSLITRIPVLYNISSLPHHFPKPIIEEMLYYFGSGSLFFFYVEYSHK